MPGPSVAGVYGGWAVAGAVVGLLAGTLLRPTARRLATIGGTAPRLLALAPTTAAVLALLAGHYRARPESFAFGWLAVAGVALAFVDVAVQRLPDRLVLPAYPAVLAGLTVSAMATGEHGRLLRAVAGGVVLTGCYLLLALARPGQLGLGDVKLAGVIGMALCWIGWPALLLGSFLAFAAVAVAGLGLLATRRAALTSSLAFGPFMLGSALLVILTG